MLVSQYAQITPGKQLIMSGGLGTMGYGFPGGVGAKIGNPDKPVIVMLRRWRHADEYSGICHSRSGRASSDPSAYSITNIWVWYASGRSFSTANATV